MGKIKDALIREEDTVTAAVNRRIARVSAGGGDAMSGGMMAILAMVEQEAALKGMTLEQLAMAEAAEEEVAAAALAILDNSDKELDRVMASQASTMPAPELTEVVRFKPTMGLMPPIVQVIMTDGLAEPAPEPEVLFEMPPQDYMKKGQHFKLVFQGVCSNCAHCALKLTDSVSIERGIGPICSKRGYFEDPTDPDEMQAMIDLAEYPALVDYLTTKYKPQGVRGLMNGLVKICSLNRRSPVHQACCDAVESLGYKRLASTLRESIAIIEIKNQDDKTFHLWVKKSEWSWAWSSALRQIPGAYLSRQEKGWLVPKTQKHLLWALMIKFYSGFCAKVPGDDGGKKTVKITEKIKAPSSQPQLTPA